MPKSEGSNQDKSQPAGQEGSFTAGEGIGPVSAADPSAVLEVSGLYRRRSRRPTNPATDSDAEDDASESGEDAEVRAAAPFFEREELRLDVDGRYPQMTASGTLRRRFAGRIHWIANLAATGSHTWSGQIWYKDGNAGIFPYTDLTVRVIRSQFPNRRRAVVRFTGGGAPLRRRRFRFNSPYFHRVEFEYDREQGAERTLSVDSCGHPNRPASLPCEPLEIETVFRRAGFRARRSQAADVIPSDGPDLNATWSDAEMHDAMQSYWSRFANRRQWALWVLFARQHDDGHGLGGIMFDDIGPNHRQGTAVFTNSFISDPPPGDPAPADWVERMRFWTAVHEMGHAFNLAHSWQKHLGTPWIPLPPEPEARSFMNYPYGVAGGESAFFADFEFRFSDGELLFMRHAPKRFVQMGNADWFDHHGFEDSLDRPNPDFRIEIAVDRDAPTYEFLEPVVLELKLTNVSDQPKVLPADLLADSEHMVVIIKKDGKPARRWWPYAAYCHGNDKTVLGPGESMTESLFVSAGRNGADLAEPGYYALQMAMEVEDGDVVSEPLRLRVAPPRSYDEEYVAQDAFSDDAGRVMAFDGSKVLESGNNAWHEVVERLPKSKAAIHAQVALALPQIRNYRTLRIDAPEDALALGGQGAFHVAKAKVDDGRRALDKALLADPLTAMTTLGRVDYEYYCRHFRALLTAADGDKYVKKVDQIFRQIAKGRAAKLPVKGRAGAGKTRA